MKGDSLIYLCQSVCTFLGHILSMTLSWPRGLQFWCFWLCICHTEIITLVPFALRGGQSNNLRIAQNENLDLKKHLENHSKYISAPCLHRHLPNQTCHHLSPALCCSLLNGLGDSILVPTKCVLYTVTVVIFLKHTHWTLWFKTPAASPGHLITTQSNTEYLGGSVG